MKKIDNKGFIATSVLFGIVALLFLTFSILLGNSKASLKTDRLYGQMLKEDFNVVTGVELHANGGIVSQSVVELKDTDTYGLLPEPTRDGFTFNSWCSKIDGGVCVDDSMIHGEYLFNKLFAKWNKNKYHLVINPNQGTYKGSTGIVQKTLDFEEEFQLDIPTRNGYVFAGWEVKSDSDIGGGTGSRVSEKVFQMGYDHTEIIAKWEPKKVAVVIDPAYGSWNGSYDIYSTKIDYLSTIQVPDPIRDGYTFAGWEISPEGLDSQLSGTTLTVGENDIKLTATWRSNTYKYYVKHYKQGLNGELTLVDADTEEKEAEIDTTVETTHNTYRGFTVLVPKLSIFITSDINQNIAEYQYARNQYQLTIDPAGGSYNGETTKNLRYEESFTLQQPTKNGYNFTNWTASSGKIVDNIFTIDAANSTVTANWTSKDVIVTYDARGGVVNKTSDTKKYDQNYGTLPTPTRTGYTFQGWYTKAPGSDGVKITSTTKLTNTNDHILYAHWLSADASTVTYTNSQYTTCQNLKCAFDELYQKFK